MVTFQFRLTEAQHKTLCDIAYKSDDERCRAEIVRDAVNYYLRSYYKDLYEKYGGENDD